MSGRFAKYKAWGAADGGRLLALACLTGGGLALEIALTRLLATRFYPPYVFAVLSLAVLGIGAGAALAARWPALARRERIPQMMLAAALSACLVIVLILRWQGLTDAMVVPAARLALCGERDGPGDALSRTARR